MPQNPYLYDKALSNFLLQKSGMFPSSREISRGYNPDDLISRGAQIQQDIAQREHELEASAPYDVIGGISETAKSIGYGLTRGVLGSVVRGIEGAAGANIVEPDWRDSIINWVNRKDQERLSEAKEKYGHSKFLPGIKVTDATELGGNLGYSIANMGSSLLAGLGTAVLTESPLAGYAAGAGTSFAGSKRMSGNEFMMNVLRNADEQKRKYLGKGLTKDEENGLKGDFMALADEYGTWEAIPETLGNLVGYHLITAPLKKYLGGTIARQVAERFGAGLLEEMATETVTQLKQQDVMARAGLPGGREIDWSASGVLQAAKEVFPQVVLLTGLLGGAGGAAMAVRGPIKRSAERGKYNRFRDTMDEYAGYDQLAASEGAARSAMFERMRTGGRPDLFDQEGMGPQQGAGPLPVGPQPEAAPRLAGEEYAYENVPTPTADMVDQETAILEALEQQRIDNIQADMASLQARIEQAIKDDKADTPERIQEYQDQVVRLESELPNRIEFDPYKFSNEIGYLSDAELQVISRAIYEAQEGPIVSQAGRIVADEINKRNDEEQLLLEYKPLPDVVDQYADSFDDVFSSGIPSYEEIMGGIRTRIKERRDAGRVRKDQRQPGEQGDAAERGEGVGGADIQQTAEKGAGTGDKETREVAPGPVQAEEEGQAPAQAEEEAHAPAQAEEEAQAPAQAEEEAQAPGQAPVKEEAHAPAQAEEEAQAPAQAEEEAQAPGQAPVKEEVPAPAPAPAEEEVPAPAHAEEEGQAPAPAEEEVPAPAPAEEEVPAPGPASVEEEVPAPAPSVKTIKDHISDLKRKGVSSLGTTTVKIQQDRPNSKYSVEKTEAGVRDTVKSDLEYNEAIGLASSILQDKMAPAKEEATGPAPGSAPAKEEGVSKFINDLSGEQSVDLHDVNRILATFSDDELLKASYLARNSEDRNVSRIIPVLVHRHQYERNKAEMSTDDHVAVAVNSRQNKHELDRYDFSDIMEEFGIKPIRFRKSLRNLSERGLVNLIPLDDVEGRNPLGYITYRDKRFSVGPVNLEWSPVTRNIDKETIEPAMTQNEEEGIPWMMTDEEFNAQKPLNQDTIIGEYAYLINENETLTMAQMVDRISNNEMPTSRVARHAYNALIRLDPEAIFTVTGGALERGRREKSIEAGTDIDMGAEPREILETEPAGNVPGTGEGRGIEELPPEDTVPGGAEVSEGVQEEPEVDGEYGGIDVRETGGRETGDISTGPKRLNYRITESDNLETGGKWTKFEANATAIRLLKQIEAEGRMATAEEQSILVQYTGWGRFPDIFSESPGNASLERRRETLKSLLTEEEYTSARKSTVNAHYTSPNVARAMWDAISRMGLKPKRILDPSMGATGIFQGTMPSSFGKVAMTGVEIDSLSGRIAQQLYQGFDVRIQGFEDLKVPDNHFDLAISNVPFGDYKVYDPKYNKFKYNIHNYFFHKALDKVRPGGVVAFITSTGTLNTVGSKPLREYLDRNAILIGAVRLPAKVFSGIAGTDVTTDIIFLRKRMDGEVQQNVPWKNTYSMPIKSGGETIIVQNNEYYRDNQDMQIGIPVPDKLHRNRLGLNMRKTFAEDFQAALSKMVENYTGNFESSDIQIERELGEIYSEQAPSYAKENSFHLLRNGGLGFVEDGRLYKSALEGKRAERAIDFINVRDSYYDVIKTQLEFDDEGYDRALKALNKTYDGFVKKHGRINDNSNILVLSNDPDFHKIGALEVDYKAPPKDQSVGTAKKAAIFTERTLNVETVPTSASSAKDAMIHSLNVHGDLNIDFMMRLYPDHTEYQIEEELGDSVYRDPETGQMVLADEYLSGDVVSKLDAAHKAGMDRNVKALEKVLPEPVTAEDIFVIPGQNWIPQEYVEDFATRIAGVRVEIKYSPTAAIYDVKPVGPLDENVAYLENGLDVNGARLSSLELLESIMNGRTPDRSSNLRPFSYSTVYPEGAAVKHRDKYYRAKTETNDMPHPQSESWEEIDKAELDGEVKTSLASASEKIIERFRDYLFNDTPSRSSAMVDLYNREKNRLAERNFDGSHLSFPGITKNNADGSSFSFRPHQLDAIWRIITTGNTLLAHGVGTGKTYTMIAAAMEMKRLKMVNKPMFVVPNHLIGQWARSFMTLYPNADILVAQEKDFSTANRKRFMATVATGNYDAVIVKMSSFGLLPLSSSFQIQFVNKEIRDLEEVLRELGAEEDPKKKTRQVKQIEKQLDNAKVKLQELINAPRKDTHLTFEELGVDFLFVDEAHNYKNLFFVTKKNRIAGLPNTRAQRATDMFMKTRYLEQMRPGRSVVMATGTPISNALAESYTMQRFLQYSMLEANGILPFDSWASLYGATKTGTELSPNGKTYRQNTRFVRFMNLPELSKLFRQVADVKMADEVDLDLPKLKGDKPIVVPVPRSEQLATYIDSIIDRMEALKGGKIDPREDNFLKATNDGRKAALDIRLVIPDAPEPEHSKTKIASEILYQQWKESAGIRGTQIVFCDLSIPSKHGAKERARLVKEAEAAEKEGREANISMDEWLAVGSSFSVYDDLKAKLLGKGIPEREVQFIHDWNTDKRKAELFRKMNSGEVRILIGSTQRMGEGMNAQERMVSMIEIDAPWRPSDVEQRRGRIVRQGNINKEVSIHRIVTEKSFDAYIWQTIETKALMIHSFLEKNPDRSVEDISMVAMSAAEAKAAAGDPRIIPFIEATIALKRLEMERNAYNATISKIKYRMDSALPSMISRREERLSGARKDLSLVEKTKEKKDRELIINGTEIKKTDEIDTAIFDALGRPEGKSDSIEIGTFRGFKIIVRATLLDTTSGRRQLFDLALVSPKTGNSFSGSMGETPSQALANANRRLSYIKTDIATNERDLSNLRKELDQLKSKEQGGFPKEKEYLDTKARFELLESEMMQHEEDEAEANDNEDHLLEDSLISEESQLEDAVSYSVASRAGAVDAAQVAKALPGWNVSTTEDGLTIEKNGVKAPVALVDRIEIDPARFEAVYGRKPTKDELTRGAAGRFVDGRIEISPTGDAFTVGHEMVHFGFETGIFTIADARAVLKVVNPEAARKLTLTNFRDSEEEIAQYIEKKMVERGRMPKMIRAIVDFIDRLMGLFTGKRTAGSVVRKLEQADTGAATGVSTAHVLSSAAPMYSVWGKTTEAYGDFLNAWKNREKGWTGLMPDTSLVDRVFSLPSHYFQKVPQLQKMFEEALEYTKNKFTLQRAILYTPDGKESHPEVLNKFMKEDKAEYGKIRDYLLQRDRDQVGFIVREMEGEKQKSGAPFWQVIETMGDKEIIRATETSKDRAWARAIQEEQKDYVKAGGTEQAGDALARFRTVSHNEFRMLQTAMTELIEFYESKGKPLPEISYIGQDGETIKIDLKRALAEMGDRRGYYFPRLRESGRWSFYAWKDGENPVFMQSDWRERVNLWESKYRKMGYQTSKTKSNKMPEIVFQLAGSIVSQQAMMQEALNNAGKNTKESIEQLEEMRLAFAESMVMNVADIIKSRGARSAMIRRSGAIGGDVWIGYEEDPILAMTKSAVRIAGGRAKHDMAVNMVKIMTGTEVSWDQFKADNEGAEYEDYLKMVKAARIDPAKQENAFVEGVNYMKDMLRNDEDIDRFMGSLRGIAVLKYLGFRVSSPIVNLTAMVTSVPGVLNGYHGIPIGRALKQIGQSMTDYTRFMIPRLSGKLSKTDEAIFRYIESQGWHQAQYNKEALGVLKSRAGRAWDTLIEWSMLGFGITERLNRTSTIAAAYKLLGGTVDADGNVNESLMYEAEWLSNRGHGIYNKPNLPYWARGPELGAQALRSGYVFKTFSHNYALTMAELGLSKRQYKAVAYMMFSPALIAGTGATAIPFFSGIVAAIGAAFGIDDPEEDLYSAVAETMGPTAETFARYGAVGTVAGVSFKGSMQLGSGGIPTTIVDLLGAPASIISDIYEGGKLVSSGETVRGIEKILPTALSTMSRSIREYEEGLKTYQNAPLFYGREVVRPDLADAIIRFASFNPASIARIKEIQWKERQVQRAYSERRQAITARAKKIYFSPVEKRSPAEVAELISDIKAYNERVRYNNVSEPLITSKSLISSLKRAAKPSKRERMRAAGK